MIKKENITTKMTFVFLAGLFFFSILLGSTSQIGEQRTLPQSATERGQILINGNEDLTPANGVTGGEGTEMDPYIIENWTIDVDSSGHGIHIQNTDKYLILRNCTVQNADRPFHNDNAINLQNVTNIVVENNTVTTSIQGISVSQIHNGIIRNNTAVENRIGFLISNSNGLVVANNTATANTEHGFHIFYSDDCLVDNNTAIMNEGHGFRLYAASGTMMSNNTATLNENSGILLTVHSDDNTLRDNQLEGNGIRVLYATNSDIDISNKVNGKSVRYYESQSGLVLSGEEDVGEVILINCDNVLIEGLQIASSSIGIQLFNTNRTTIRNNDLSSHSDSGIRMFASHNNSISNNTADTNTHGIFVRSSHGNTINGNTLISNTQGIYLEESNDSNISNNSASNGNTGILLAVSNNNVLESNHLSNNLWHGISIQSSSVNNTITNNTATGGGMGIRLWASHDNMINTNTAFTTSRGIYLSNSENNTIESNNLVENTNTGIELQSSSNNVIMTNNATANDYGIMVDTNSNSNLIWGNNFDENAEAQAMCKDSIENQWYFEGVGNFYGDYLTKYPEASNDGEVWNTAYEIDGNLEDMDLYPLVNKMVVEIPDLDIEDPDPETEDPDPETEDPDSETEDSEAELPGEYISGFPVFSLILSISVISLLLVAKSRKSSIKWQK